MKFEKLKKNYKKRIIIGGLVTLGIVSAITITTSRAKYRNIQTIPIAMGTVNYTPYDYQISYINVGGTEHSCNQGKCEDMLSYIPSSNEYTLNSNSYCETKNTSDEYERNNNIILTYQNNVVSTNLKQQKARCYLYFDLKDTEKPTISSLSTAVTKTEINVTVSANDNIGVTEYWYAIDSDNYTQETSATPNKHTFGSLTAGSTHTIKVYVKDEAGNQSDISTKEVTTTSPADETLAKLNITSYSTTTPDFSQIADTDEGVFRVEDGMYGGYSYYWRGAVLNNHIIFADKCWRIIRINGDGTIRLIYNGTKLTGDKCTGNGVSNSSSNAVRNTYYSVQANYSLYVGWTYTVYIQRPSSTTSGGASNAKTQTETWFKNNITGTNLSKVADGKFCNDRSGTGAWNSKGYTYSGNNRLVNKKNPTLNCSSPGDVYTLQVGAITADEGSMAGLVNGINNANCYLNNGYMCWTMTPAYATYQTSYYDTIAHVFAVSSGLGAYPVIEFDDDGNTYGSASIRPVINLKANITFQSGGLGTSDKPYIVQ